MKTHARIWRQSVTWCASLLALLALLAACGAPSGAATALTATATPTTLATTTPTTQTPTATATSTPRPKATATPTPRPQSTATPTPRPKPTATPTPKPQTVTIDISNFAFSPKTLTITAGTIVKWINKDSATHTTTSDSSDPASWDSGQLATNASFSFTFTRAGTYSYHCAIHPYMTATITVTT